MKRDKYMIRIGRLRLGREKNRSGFWIGQWVNKDGLRYAHHNQSLFAVFWNLWKNRKRRLIEHRVK
jgi:hypothetical protein